MKTTLILLPLLLVACSPNDPQQPAPQLFKDQHSVLDQAKTVDATQQAQDAAQRKATEQQTQ